MDLEQQVCSLPSEEVLIILQSHGRQAQLIEPNDISMGSFWVAQASDVQDHIFGEGYGLSPELALSELCEMLASRLLGSLREGCGHS